MISNKAEILIVDDSLINLSLLSQILSDEGYNVCVESTGVSAIAKANSQKFDLIFLDIMMADMDGFEVCSQLKNNPKTKDIPIIFLTARNDSESLVRGFELGAVDYLKKPFERMELVARTRTHIDLKRAKEALVNELQERKKAEEALSESRSKYKTLFNRNNDAIFIFHIHKNLPDKFQEVNNTARKVLGYTKKEICKMYPQDILTQETSINLSRMIKIILKKKHIIFETTIITKDGTHIPVELNSTAFKFKNKMSVLSVARNITDRKEIQRKIVTTIIKTEEKERKRFAKDLHDGLGALLSSINIYLNLLELGKFKKEELPQTITEMKELLNEAIDSSKEIANNIKPNVLTNFGLVASINSFCNKLNSTKVISIFFNAKNFNCKLEHNTETIIFRILNEFINNTLKHASANHIKIYLSNSDNLISVYYSDDGIGFNVAEKLNGNDENMGLQNIINRIKTINGIYSIKSTKNRGMRAKMIIRQ